MQECAFHSVHGQTFTFSSPPILVQGFFSAPLYMIENTILIGHKPLPVSARDIANNKGIMLSMLEQRTRKV